MLAVDGTRAAAPCPEAARRPGRARPRRSPTSTPRCPPRTSRRGPHWRWSRSPATRARRSPPPVACPATRWPTPSPAGARRCAARCTPCPAAAGASGRSARSPTAWTARWSRRARLAWTRTCATALAASSTTCAWLRRSTRLVTRLHRGPPGAGSRGRTAADPAGRDQGGAPGAARPAVRGADGTGPRQEPRSRGPARRAAGPRGAAHSGAAPGAAARRGAAGRARAGVATGSRRAALSRPHRSRPPRRAARLARTVRARRPARRADGDRHRARRRGRGPVLGSASPATRDGPPALPSVVSRPGWRRRCRR